MALSLDDLKAHANITGDADDAVLARLLAAATKHVERVLGFPLDDTDELPEGAPADLEQAVYLLAAHWFENRETALVGLTTQPLPFGVADILAEHRRYTFG
ncbi:head-tail connector protein [Blastochloris viridis]|uniref:Phage gp6-like head-tail connector protein n=1 Tax=Blastochloris viridis TaxID=1079 RepID=A0A0H5BHI7_BLAVI|nr:head-tail connector protein [Blastochloris viridis]ALK09501.1 Phage gp6-like head-tail connector protein [Blastochloris viridis]BAS00615.1 hypothetical protein BV133_3021 [Blastochloris viridis]CUU42164.1 hypothetical protein BVIRIDIS_11700 [Blastochloris viridis]